MGLERRGNNYYRYKKRRVGKRIISEYCGGGHLANLMQLLDQADREEANLEKEAKARSFEAEKQSQTAIDQVIESFCEEAKALEIALFLINGYHTHERQWRKKRNGNKTETKQA